MECERTALGLVRLVDDELTVDERRRVEAHADVCEDCGRTLSRLLREDEALRLAFAPMPRKGAGEPRLFRAAVAAMLVLTVSLVVLFAAYRGLTPVAPPPTSAARALDRPVRLDANGRPLSECLALISGQSEVEIRLADDAVDKDRPVHIKLVQPIRMESLLEIFEDFYDLSRRMEGGVILLE